jgi:hypothetical protein
MNGALSQQQLLGLSEAPALAQESTKFLWRSARAVSSFPAVIAGSLAALVFAACKYQVDDPDIWWHLRNARFLTEHLRLPNVDTYSFTVAGYPWINHEWLSELFYYIAFLFAGWRGIYIVFGSILALLFVSVFCLCRAEKADPLAAAISTIAGVVLAMVGFGPRTQHFGWACFLAIYAILLRFRSTRRAPLWLIPCLFAFWINCHGGWSIGLAVYAIFLCAGLVRHDFGRLTAAPWSKSDLEKLVVVCALSIAALFVNPYGYRLVIYPFQYAGLQLNLAITDEWLPINFSDDRGKLVAVILGAVFAIAVGSKKRWRIDEAVLTAFVLYCGLCHVRFLLLAGIILPPILAPKLGNLSSYDPTQQRRVLNSVILATLAALCIYRLSTAGKQDKELAPSLPAHAVAFLKAHPPQGRLFNLYNWGGYVEWQLPNVPTFIDSRADIFELRGVLKDYLQIAKIDGSEQLLDRYQIGYVFYAADSPLARLLSRSSEWQCVYKDEQAVIFRRALNTPSQSRQHG